MISGPLRTRLIIWGIAIILAALAAASAFAQTSTLNYVVNGNTSSGGLINAPVGVCTTCVPMPVTTSSSGGAIATKPDASISTGYQQITSLASAVTITPGAGSTYCVVVPEVQAVRYRDDGTAPTASVGFPLAVAQPAVFRLVSFTSLQFIQQAASATLDVDCYKDQ